MRLAIIGYGGLESCWRGLGKSRGWISAKITSSDEWTAEGLDCDLSSEHYSKSAAGNVLVVNVGLPVVVGSTGWHSRIREIEDLVEEKQGLVFHATNFSIGVHLLNNFSELMSKAMSSFEEYTPAIEESHHIHKLDKPSGTAITLANKVKSAGDYSEIKVDSIREGEIIGTHELVWDSSIDRISIKHEAKNRSGFAMGAVKASNWLLEQKSKGVSGIFTMDDMIKEIK